MSEDAAPIPAAVDGDSDGDTWPPAMPTATLIASEFPTGDDFRLAGETRIAEPAGPPPAGTAED